MAKRTLPFIALSLLWALIGALALWWYDKQAQQRMLFLMHQMWSVSPAKYGIEVDNNA